MSKLTESEIDANDRGLKYVEMTQSALSKFAILERNYIDTIRNLQAENAQLIESLDKIAYRMNCIDDEAINIAEKGLIKSQDYERYQAMQKVCEAAKVWNSEPDDADEWANATLRLSQAVDALEALDDV